jgi:hypothetical protein
VRPDRPLYVGRPEAADLLDACARVARHAARRGALRPLLGVIVAHEDDGPRDLAGRWFVRALARWARSVRWVREPIAVGELVMPPSLVLREGWGDCDDVATAAAAVAVTVGLRARLVWYESGAGRAHMVCAVSETWDGSSDRAVIIDQLADTSALSVGLDG